MTDKHTLVGAMPWKAAIWQHSGATDTVCIKDARGNEIVGWLGFDGAPGTKADIRARCRLIVRAVNAYSSMATRITALEAEKAEMVKAMRYILPYLEWTIGKESPGHHPTMPSAVAEFRATLAKHQEGEGK